MGEYGNSDAGRKPRAAVRPAAGDRARPGLTRRAGLRLRSTGQRRSAVRGFLAEWRQLLTSLEGDLGRLQAAAQGDLPPKTRKHLRLWRLRARRDLERAAVVVALAGELLGGVETCLRCADGDYQSAAGSASIK